MKFADYSPPAFPTEEQQLDALRKGLGRVMQWADAGKLEHRPVLEASLHDLRFDRSVDDCRGAWLWKAASVAKYDLALQEPLLHALQHLANADDAQQLCEFAYYYAAEMKDGFRERLYQIVEKPFPESPWLGEEQLIALDGEKGFLFAVRARGARLSSRAWEWHDRNPFAEATKRFGEAFAFGLLDASEDESVGRYRDALRNHEELQKITSNKSHQERMQAIGVDEIIAAAETRDARYGRFRGWGMHARADDLEKVFARLLESHDSQTINKYLAVFSNRAVPRLDRSLFALCEHEDETVRNRTYRVLAQCVDPAVRELAEAHLKKGISNGAVLSLFVKNFQVGDEEMLFEALQLPDDLNELHWLLMEVIDVLEANLQADCFQMGTSAYFLTPCGACRFRAARHLYKQNAAPEWLVDECRNDSDEETRQLLGPDNSSSRNK